MLFLGRFSAEKNCHLLIEAFGRLDTSVDLVLAGGKFLQQLCANAMSARWRKCSLPRLRFRRRLR